MIDRRGQARDRQQAERKGDDDRQSAWPTA
jgi:hypothetical protein